MDVLPRPIWHQQLNVSRSNVSEISLDIKTILRVTFGMGFQLGIKVNLYEFW